MSGAVRRLPTAIASFLLSMFFLVGNAAAQSLGGGDATDVPTGRLIAGLILLVVIGAVALFIVKAKGQALKLWQRNDDRRLRVVETMRLSPQATLVLANLDDTEFLLAFSGNGALVVTTKLRTPREPGPENGATEC